MDGRVREEHERGVAGGIIALVRLSRRHKKSLIFDLRDRLGLRLSDVRGLPASEAFSYLFGLTRDPKTHTYAALADQTFPGSQADAALVLLATAVINIGRKTNERVTLPGPYFGYAERKKRQEFAKVDPAEKARLAERLRRYSSIPE